MISTWDISVGNYVDIAGEVKMITSVSLNEDGSFLVKYKPDNEVHCKDFYYQVRPIKWDLRWAIYFNVHDENIPPDIEFVHRMQNLYASMQGINFNALVTVGSVAPCILEENSFGSHL